MSVSPTDNNESLLDLPPVNPQQGAEGGLNAVTVEPVKRQGSEVNPEFLPTQPASTAGVVQQTQTVADPSANDSQVALAAQTQPSPASAVPQSQIADDVDLIEKEWVDRAKEIVNKTKHDPRLQSEELNKVKKEYIKQRFNKDVRT